MSRRVRRRPARALAVLAAAVVLTTPVTASAAPSAGPVGPDCLSTSIAARWAQVGGATGRLGPVVACTAPTRAGTGSFATFARGSVYDHPGTGTWDVSGAFRVRWSEFGWEDGVLGWPVSGEEPADRGGVLQEYEHGTLFWSGATGAWAVRGPVEDLYAGQGWEEGPLGYPVADQQSLRRGDGTYQPFTGGSVYSSPASGTHTVSGSFRDLYAGTGWENGFLGYPTSEETGIRDGGVYQTYQGGTMYWTPSTGAHTVSGSFLRLYANHGWENGPLGYPTTQEIPTRDGVFQRFQGGVAYWSPATGETWVLARGLPRYAAAGYENGPLGFPASLPVQEADGGGWQVFQGGWTAWSPTGGVHVLRDHFALAWFQDRRVPGGGTLGYPTGEETAGTRGGRYQSFERGAVYLTRTRQAYAVAGAVFVRYGQTGWENGALGYPAGHETDVPGGRRQNFENGWIDWNATTGATTVTLRR